MIPARLEELILAGLAEYRTHSGLSSAAITVPCPEGKQIVLIDFTFIGGPKIGNIITTGLFFVKFYGVDQKSQNVISFFLPAMDTGGLFTTAHFNQSLYLCYQSSCRIDIACMLPVAFTSVDFNPMTSEAKDLPVTGGYGIVEPVIRAIEFTGGDFYIPQGIDFTAFGAAAPGFRNDPFPDIVAGATALPNLAGSVDTGFTVNIGYVILNKPLIPKN